MTWRATGVSASAVPPGGIRELLLGTRSVVLARIGGTIVAFDGYCPHEGGLLADGRIEGDRIRCPVHEAAFALPSGEVRADPHGIEPPAGGVGPLPVFPVRLVGPEVEVDLPNDPR